LRCFSARLPTISKPRTARLPPAAVGIGSFIGHSPLVAVNASYTGECAHVGIGRGRGASSRPHKTDPHPRTKRVIDSFFTTRENPPVISIHLRSIRGV
jgi:hypothetical protein